LETATTVCSVSLAKDGNLLALKEQNGDYSHAENLTVFIEDILKESKISIASLDAIAVSKGPGSYTGLRIGVSVAKGLCYSLNKPLIAINTLQHLALSVSNLQNANEVNTLYCPLLDARRMEVYCALFNKLNQTIMPTEAKIMDEHSFEVVLKSNKVFFFGDGAHKCKSLFVNYANAHFIENIFLSAKSMVSLSELAFKNEHFEDVAYFEPFYLKDFVSIPSKLKQNISND
jgi:tRNA threonylcarbamoyladenosine biosynthesis protein TsaB